MDRRGDRVSQRITIQVEDGCDVTESMVAIARWFERHKSDPVKSPLTGTVLTHGGIRLFRRDYRKGLCFVAWKEAGV